MDPLRGAQQVPAEDQGVRRLLEVGERALVAHGKLERGFAGDIAQVGVVVVIRRPVHPAEVLLDVRETVVLAEPGQTLRAVLVPDPGEVFGHLRHRLVPGDRLPLAAAAFAHANHRRLQPVGVIQRPEPGISLGAESSGRIAIAVIYRRQLGNRFLVVCRRVGDVVGIGHPLDLDRASVDDVDFDARLAAAHVAVAVDPFPVFEVSLLRAGLPEKAKPVIPQ